MAAGEATSGRRVALTTAVAGLVETLAGTVVGGLISLAAVDENIRAEEASDLRANRQSVYSALFTDLNARAQLIEDDLRNDGTVDLEETRVLKGSNDELARSISAG
jgi:hypothetical protein